MNPAQRVRGGPWSLILCDYILECDLDGLKWWPHIEGLIKRDTAGKRPSSVVAKPIADLMHFILGERMAISPKC